MSTTTDFRQAIHKMTMDSPHGLNCFVRVLIDEIIIRAQLFSEQDEIPEGMTYIQHPLPQEKDGFKFFPLADIQDTDDHYDTALLSDWLKCGGNIHSFKYAGNELIADNSASHLIKKIRDIAEQSVLCLKKIREDVGMGIPMDSLISMVSIMTCFRNRLAQRVMAPIPYGCSQEFVAVPNSIDVSHRDAYILKINLAIYDLLEEAFIVFMIAGIGENRAIVTYMNSNPAPELSQIKDFLKERTCCQRMDQNLMSICSMDGINEHIGREYSSLAYLAPYFSDFIEHCIGNNALKRIHLRRDRVPKISTLGDMWDHELKESYPSFLRPKNEILSINNIEKDFNNEDSTISDTEITDIDMFDFESCIREEFEDKFYPKPLDTYELVGDPSNLRYHIPKIIANCSRSVIENEGNKIPDVGVSYRTGRRYKQELKKRKADRQVTEDIDDDDIIEAMINLKKEKAQMQKHEKPGYLSQNLLIVKLTDVDYLNQYGFSGKIYGRTTLMKKIKSLIENGEIITDRNSNAKYFNEGDLQDIINKIYINPVK